MSAFFNSFRSKAVGYKGFDMYPHWRELKLLLDAVSDDGAKMQDRQWGEAWFCARQGKAIDYWRQHKYGRVYFLSNCSRNVGTSAAPKTAGRLVERLYKVDETDPLMPAYHTTIAESLYDKLRSMAEEAVLDIEKPQRVRELASETPTTNDDVGRGFGILDDVFG